MEYQCFIDGCGFVFDGDDPEWRERFEQHVRWIHLPENDFGSRPVASLFGLLVYGVISEEEFSRLAGEAMVRACGARSAVVPIGRFSAYAFGASAFGLAATTLLLAWNARLVSLHRTTVTLLLLAVSLSLLVGALSFDLAFRRLLRGTPAVGDVRFSPYPDTGNDDDDSGG